MAGSALSMVVLVRVPKLSLWYQGIKETLLHDVASEDGLFVVSR